MFALFLALERSGKRYVILPAKIVLYPLRPREGRELVVVGRRLVLRLVQVTMSDTSERHPNPSLLPLPVCFRVLHEEAGQQQQDQHHSQLHPVIRVSLCLAHSYEGRSTRLLPVYIPSVTPRYGARFPGTRTSLIYFHR